LPNVLKKHRKQGRSRCRTSHAGGLNEAAPLPSIPDHSAHHGGHKLKRVDGPFFICDGCEELGTGTRYRCEHKHCNFDLHTCCAVAPETLTQPVFGNDRVFVFLLEPPAMDTTGGIRVAANAC
jgi:hypothetical protein